MKAKTDNRLKKSKEVTKEELINEIKSSNEVLFDQMLIENEERKTYFYVNHISTAFTRVPKKINFPLFDHLKDGFDELSNKGDVQILNDESFIGQIESCGKKGEEAKKYSNKNLIFSELELKLNGNDVDLHQPIYYIPEDKEQCKCGTCKGDKYTKCTETECRGQHIYDCSKCRTSGKVDCKDCGARGEYTCPSCNGRGLLRCTGCGGSGIDKDSNSRNVKCKHCNGSGQRKCSSLSGHGLLGAVVKKAAGNEYCGGSGIIKCGTCHSTGQITCKKCEGDGRIECKTCYGDHYDNRYGKVDCKTCETAGELATFTYIETSVLKENVDFLCADGKIINAPTFGKELVKNHVDISDEKILTFKNINHEKTENYDVYSSFCSKKALEEKNIYKDRYPLVVKEEMNYEGVPCATISYNHILSATQHEVSIIGIDATKEVLFHSNPASVENEKVAIKDTIKELISKAFTTKSYKDKIERKHEILLMIHMAKADGIIQEEEKKYLSSVITGLDRFTIKEKSEIFSLMSVKELPTITPLSSYFYSVARAEEAKNKVIGLVAKADGNYSEIEKAKFEEINKAIEEGFKVKPNPFVQFFKTWQVSLSILIIISLLIYSAYYFVVEFPKLKHSEVKEINSSEYNDELNNVESSPINVSDKTFYKIQDPDGYSNLRDKPNGSVLKKVYENEKFEVLGEENKHFKVKLEDGTVGFIHKSRVVKIEDKAVNSNIEEVLDVENFEISQLNGNWQNLEEMSRESINIIDGELIITKQGNEDHYFINNNKTCEDGFWSNYAENSNYYILGFEPNGCDYKLEIFDINNIGIFYSNNPMKPVITLKRL
ncbi:MAG: hypothetical protein H6584_08575 [Flavobacteriales bacterium]|nr:hypothetical protein [Flavobacteriales bacterium]